MLTNLICLIMVRRTYFDPNGAVQPPNGSARRKCCPFIGIADTVAASLGEAPCPDFAKQFQSTTT
jgi:hypothetical protein